MEDLVQILLFGMFGLFIFLGKKKKMDLPDFIPEMKEENQENEPQEDAPAFSDAESAVLRQKILNQESSLSMEVNRFSHPSPTRKTQTMKKKETKEHSVSDSQRIRLKTRSEARKAFLYSEIFTRKYEH